MEKGWLSTGEELIKSYRVVGRGRLSLDRGGILRLCLKYIYSLLISAVITFSHRSILGFLPEWIRCPSRQGGKVLGD